MEHNRGRQSPKHGEVENPHMFVIMPGQCKRQPRRKSSVQAKRPTPKGLRHAMKGALSKESRNEIELQIGYNSPVETMTLVTVEQEQLSN